MAVSVFIVQENCETAMKMRGEDRARPVTLWVQEKIIEEICYIFLLFLFTSTVQRVKIVKINFLPRFPGSPAEGP